jgi:hypothetical protein
MNIAVADEGGNIVAHVRMDNAWIGSIDISMCCPSARLGRARKGWPYAYPRTLGGSRRSRSRLRSKL